MLAGMRLLATDLDGTLVFHHAVGQADAEALVRWREAGNLLVLATGRSVRLVQHAVEVARASTSIGLDYDYAVCATGTTVIDAATLRPNLHKGPGAASFVKIRSKCAGPRQWAGP